MSSGKLWGMAMQAQAKEQASLMAELSAKHHRIMRFRKWFHETFGADVKQFYKDIYLGFDVIAFDDYLMTKDEEYRKANAGELGEDVDCSMRTHLEKRYGAEAACRIGSFI